MLKHVQISPHRNRSDSLSLRSSTSCASSICGSPEPSNDLQRTPSRASSYSSLNETLPQTTIKVFTNCLRIDIEYKTLGIQWDTTSKEVIGQLLRRLKMRHRDPRLFYLSMEVTVRRAGVKTVLILDDEARPAILQACHPKGDSRFCLQLRPGGLIRVHTSALQPTSQYKSLVISQETTSDELLCILLSCYNSLEPVEQFSLYEVCPGQEYQRKLHPDDIPLKAQNERIQRGETCHFLVRRNPNYTRRRQILSSVSSLIPSSVNSTIIEEIESNQRITTNPKTNNSNEDDNNNNDNKNNNNNNNDEYLKPNKMNSNYETTVLMSNLTLTEDLNTKQTESEQFLPNNEINSSDSYCCNDDNENSNEKNYFRRNTITSITIAATRKTESTASLLSSSPQHDEKNLINLYKIESNDNTIETDPVIKTNLNLQNNNEQKQQQQRQNQQKIFKICQKCRNTFKSCEFCNKNSTAMILNSSIKSTQSSSSASSSSTTLSNNFNYFQQTKNYHQQKQQQQQQQHLNVDSYNPVYNIREIRTVSHSFSSFGNDKKILDIDFGTHLIPLTASLTKTTNNCVSNSVETVDSQTLLKIPIKSVNIKNSSKQEKLNTNKNPTTILTLMPFTTKSQNFIRSNQNSTPLTITKNNNNNNNSNCNNKQHSNSNDLNNTIIDLNGNKITTEKLIAIQAAQISLDTTNSMKKQIDTKTATTRLSKNDKNSNRTTENDDEEKVNNNPAKGLGHFVYI